jgi:rhodanese-related sulfurtransferase
MRLLKVAVGFLVLVLGSLPARAAGGDVPRMSPEELKSLLGHSDVVIVDSRLPGDWDSGEGWVRGAVRGDPGDVDSWADRIPKDKTVVVYCS